MSPSPDDLSDDPNVGRLGESPEEFERRRIRHFNRVAEQLNQRQADRPMRENFGANEQESWDDPQSTHEAIARMKASRAPALVRAGQGPGEPTQRLEPPGPVVARPNPDMPTPLALPTGVSAELGLMVRDVISELGRGLARKFDDLRQDLEENTRLLGVMNAPMEAITESHERASHSFETLRRDIASISGTGSAPAIEALTKVVDTAGLGEAQSRAERRFEELASGIDKRMSELVTRMDTAFKGIALDMTKVLHLLERLQARELREMQRRAEVKG